MTDKQQLQICIVIPFYHGSNQLRRCLEHLANSEFQEYEIVLVDHRPADSPALADMPESLTARTTLLRGSDSLWWTGAINLGISKALESACPYIMLLNHDCYLGRKALSELLHSAHSNPDALVAPVQVDWDSGKTMIVRAYTCYLLGFPTLIPPPALYGKSEKIDVLSTGIIVGGRGVLVSKSVFEKVGLLDFENLPHYGSDHDFYMRCKRAGFDLLVAGQARAFIERAQTSTADNKTLLNMRQFVDSLKSPRSHRNIKDQLALFRKYYPIPGLYPVGVVLNVIRYFLVFGIGVIARKLKFGAAPN